MDAADRLAVLEAAVARLEALVAEQAAEIVLKDGALIAQRDRIDELERALEDVRRGGKRQAAPFSKGNIERHPKRPGRKGGDAHGRHGHRAAPAGPPDRVLDAGLPVACPDCGATVVCDRVEEQWQVDIPPKVAATVTRFDVEVGHCGGCGKRVQGRHAEQTSQALGAAASSVGPNAKALGAWLHYSLGLSFERTAAVLARFGITVTRAAIAQASATSASRELVAVHAELVTAANRSPVLTMDETGWRVGGDGAWMWVATNSGLTLYWVTAGRGFPDATETITADYAGTIVRDGWVVYNRYDHATHQSCLAHLLRRCHEMEADLAGVDRKIPRQVKAILGDALAARDLDAPARAAAAVELAGRVERLAGRPVAHDANRRLIKHLAAQAPHLFTFLTAGEAADVDATNWRAETGIRPAVVNRKTWGGNRTWNGARTQGIIASILRTATQHGHDAVGYLADRARAPDPGLAILLA
ncbi:IS66 family transposase [Acidiferrimicrobium sp. IK]|uniref:IS66 family transposase n=1 Tax=Acidiferrimicrobium sp. IK TaxID=2871700 RepID=UPI0021CAF4D2|nr:IS66 family transposase [Acidiferrimicrobium sp. IK]MCU4187534.1 IS66 family transposase [Acidiferrimicrobium sp. IK]